MRPWLVDLFFSYLFTNQSIIKHTMNTIPESPCDDEKKKCLPRAAKAPGRCPILKPIVIKPRLSLGAIREHQTYERFGF